MKCPKKHHLPNVIDGVQCAPDWCAGEGTADWQLDKPKLKRKGGNVDPYNKALAGAELTQARAIEKGETHESIKEALGGTGLVDVANKAAGAERAKEMAKLGRAIAKHEARRAVTKTPKGLSAEDGKAFVEKKLDELLPEAVGRVEYELKFGDEQNSLKAAYEVLDRRGYGKRENNPLQGAPIVIVQQNGPDGQQTTYKPAWLAVDSEPTGSSK